MNNKSIMVLMTSLLLLLGLENTRAQDPTQFEKMDSTSGINHFFEVYEGFLGGGACVFDFNNDGFDDVFLTGGVNKDRLYLNLGNGKFKDIYEESGLTDTKKFVTQGVASADVNRDGFADLLITTNTKKDKVMSIPRAENLLFLNNGDKTFKNATKKWGLMSLQSFSTGIAFGDVNKDGYPDAYIGNYFHEYSGPLDEINDQTFVNASTPAKGYLLINQGGKRFKEAYETYGLSHKGFGFGGLFTDFDNDGDQDILINNDFGYKSSPNHFLENLYPEPKFKYVEEQKNMDLAINAMGSAVADYDHDGFLDYFVTNIKFNYFMVNDGAVRFNNMADSLGTQLFAISWGANFCDFDHDGDLDLFVSNGDLNPNCTPMVNFYFENNQGKFIENARRIGLNDYGLGRGSVIFDMENDGDEEVLVVNQKAVLHYPIPSLTTLFRNNLSTGNWLQVKLRGRFSETNGIGSRIVAYYQGLPHIHEIDGGGSSHLSQNSSIAHFGLGELAKVDSIVVLWASGAKSVKWDVPANQRVVIEEDLQRKSPSFSKIGIYLLVSFLLLIFTYLYVRFLRNK